MSHCWEWEHIWCKNLSPPVSYQSFNHIRQWMWTCRSLLQASILVLLNNHLSSKCCYHICMSRLIGLLPDHVHSEKQCQTCLWAVSFIHVTEFLTYSHAKQNHFTSTQVWEFAKTSLRRRTIKEFWQNWVRAQEPVNCRWKVDISPKLNSHFISTKLKFFEHMSPWLRVKARRESSEAWQWDSGRWPAHATVIKTIDPLKQVFEARNLGPKFFL